MEYLCDYKVPVSRALWFLKLIAVGGQGCNTNVSKQKKSTTDQLASGKIFSMKRLDRQRIGFMSFKNTI